MEVLINKEPKSSFEKLLFAQEYIKVLKKNIELLNKQNTENEIEKGKMQTSIEELKHELNSYLSGIKDDDYKKRYELQKNKNIRMEKKIHELRTQNKNLVYENLKLNMKLNALQNEKCKF